MNFLFDLYGLTAIIVHACQAVLREHGIEMTDADEDVLGRTMVGFLQATYDHQQEAAAMVESITSDLEGLPVVGE